MSKKRSGAATANKTAMASGHGQPQGHPNASVSANAMHGKIEGGIMADKPVNGKQAGMPNCPTH